ncbi:putative threonine-phosphate decarboxylase [Vibrio nigripulchritudo SOn1]|uniref:threonine-phosphate decarboxylase n=1 Tax=Vibrio nigripulchritudo SOn1 TaxID=1238450 RepID=A0AAV2VTQ9_9VIBR|nr:threonine-phosphate decarboxylase CobD [Vibrio nigripulchritudo]CCO48071.1 putative threonine-phosphate decarboxylase [Vibrio nigripulchritudo SOn1]
MIHHGGKLLEMADKYGIPSEEWLDLSTGISPFTYPVGDIPNAVWNRLPEEQDGLLEAAQAYYGSMSCLPIAGSQAGIQTVPQILAANHPKSESLTVLLPAVGYKEHQHAWQQLEKAGRVSVEFYLNEPTKLQIKSADVLVVINPNNPSTVKFRSETLKQWLADMPDNSTLIVDEAFMDITQEQSILRFYPQGVPDNLVVFRSLGKFFGLAGLRVGFLFASESNIRSVQEILGPWSVSSPARFAAKKALLDLEWQAENRTRLLEMGKRMKSLLTRYFDSVDGRTLFYTAMNDRAPELFERLAEQGVLVRLCDEKNALRFGLPLQEAQWQRLEKVLDCVIE